MTTTQIIIVIAVLAIIAALAARGGPRVTQITTRREKDQREKEIEDRDDA